MKHQAHLVINNKTAYNLLLINLWGGTPACTEDKKSWENKGSEPPPPMIAAREEGISVTFNSMALARIVFLALHPETRIPVGMAGIAFSREIVTKEEDMGVAFGTSSQSAKPGFCPTLPVRTQINQAYTTKLLLQCDINNFGGAATGAPKPLYTRQLLRESRQNSGVFSAIALTIATAVSGLKPTSWLPPEYPTSSFGRVWDRFKEATITQVTKPILWRRVFDHHNQSDTDLAVTYVQKKGIYAAQGESSHSSATDASHTTRRSQTSHKAHASVKFSVGGLFASGSFETGFSSESSRSTEQGSSSSHTSGSSKDTSKNQTQSGECSLSFVLKARTKIAIWQPIAEMSTTQGTLFFPKTAITNGEEPTEALGEAAITYTPVVPMPDVT